MKFVTKGKCLICGKARGGRAGHAACAKQLQQMTKPARRQNNTLTTTARLERFLVAHDL